MYAVTPHSRVRCGLSFCVSMMIATPASSQDLPDLYGIRLDSARIAVDVVSNGCTDASHFSVRLEPGAGFPDRYRLSVVRHGQDRCRMSTHLVTVVLDIPAVPNLLGAKFLLVNSLAAPVTLRRSDP